MGKDYSIIIKQNDLSEVSIDKSAYKEIECSYVVDTYMEEIVLNDALTFEWDEWNSTKSWIKHRVSIREQEQAFFDKNKGAFRDAKHSQVEESSLLFAKTSKKRLFIIAFTKRGDKIRCISARPMNRKEVPIYEEAT